MSNGPGIAYGQVYAAHVDPVIYNSSTRDWTRAQWLELAIAALDQAGANLKVQSEVREMVDCGEDGGE